MQAMSDILCATASQRLYFNLDSSRLIKKEIVSKERHEAIQKDDRYLRN